MKIIGTDNLARETVADRHLFSIPDSERSKAQEFCDWINTFTCYDHGGTFYKVVTNDYRLSRGMADLI